jgi:hypothetical protein
MIYRGQSFSQSYDLAPPPPPPPLPKVRLPATGRKAGNERQLADERGGEGVVERPNHAILPARCSMYMSFVCTCDSEKAWSSINHSLTAVGSDGTDLQIYLCVRSLCGTGQLART